VLLDERGGESTRSRFAYIVKDKGAERKTSYLLSSESLPFPSYVTSTTQCGEVKERSPLPRMITLFSTFTLRLGSVPALASDSRSRLKLGSSRSYVHTRVGVRILDSRAHSHARVNATDQ
jgi:hypothetical protein